MIPHIMPFLHCRQYLDSHAQNMLRICNADVLTEHTKYNDHQEKLVMQFPNIFL